MDCGLMIVSLTLNEVSNNTKWQGQQALLISTAPISFFVFSLFLEWPAVQHLILILSKSADIITYAYKQLEIHATLLPH